MPGVAVDQRQGYLRSRRIGEARSPAFADVGIEGELRHDKHVMALATADEVADRSIHAPVRILENAQIDRLLCQALARLFVVAVGHADERE